VLLQTALKEGAAQLSFIGKQVEVNPAAGLFVTLNPAGKGYGGRSKLPDNLKQMFRCASSAVLHRSLLILVIRPTICVSKPCTNLR
jgi:dynein heavy chain 2